jgi:hypothetical protein
MVNGSGLPNPNLNLNLLIFHLNLTLVLGNYLFGNIVFAPVGVPLKKSHYEDAAVGACPVYAGLSPTAPNLSINYL